MWLAHMDFMRNGMHQVRFAKAHAAIQKQRVERDRATFGNAAGGGMRQFIGLAYDETFKGKARIKRCAGHAFGGDHPRFCLSAHKGFGGWFCLRCG